MNEERLSRHIKQENISLKTENSQLKRQVEEKDSRIITQGDEILRLLNQISTDMVKREDVDRMISEAVGKAVSEVTAKYEAKMKAMAAEYEAKIEAIQKKQGNNKNQKHNTNSSKPSTKPGTKTYSTKEEALEALTVEMAKVQTMTDLAFGGGSEKLANEQKPAIDPQESNADDDSLVQAPINPRGNYGQSDYEPTPRAEQYGQYGEVVDSNVEHIVHYPEGYTEGTKVYDKERVVVVWELTLPKLKKLINHLKRCLINGKKVWAKMPDTLMRSSHFGVNYTANMILNKCLNGMAELKSEICLKYQTGMETSRKTVNTHVNNVLGRLLDLMDERFRWWMTQSSYLAIDETTQKVFIECDDDKRHLRTRYIWGLRCSEQRLAYYIYDKGSRSREVIVNFLKEFIGTIQTDGATMYKIFEKVPTLNITRLSCLVHIRRYFYKSVKFEDETGIARRFLDYIQAIYTKEKLYTKLHLTPQQIKERRGNEVVPILAEMYQDLTSLVNDTTHKCGQLLLKAINYALAEWNGLIKYTTDGRYRADNNYAEQCMRDIACGRKNFLFSGSDAAARRLAFAYSLTQSCKLCGNNPYEYWTDLLTNAGRSNFKIDDYMPHLWHKKS